MAIDLSAGVEQPQIDLSAGVSSPPAKIDLSAGLQPSPSRIDLSAGLSQPAQPAGVPTGSISVYTPTVWDRIKRVFTEGVPSLSSRTVYNPKYGQAQLLSPEEALTPAEQERHPIVTGTGEFVGGLTSPESSAMIAATGGLGELPGAASVIPRLISAGFGANAIYSAIRSTPEIRDAFLRGDTSTAERLLTRTVLNVGAAALAARHATTGAGAVTGKTEPESISEDVPIHPSSPISEVVRDANVPDVRVVDSSATKAHLEGEDAEPLSSASVRGPSDVAPLRVARVVNDDHTPVIARSEVLSQAIQTAIDNSGELQKLGINPSAIKTPADAEAMLQTAADHIRTNLDPRASATLTFDTQRQLAEELGMSVEDLLSRKSGQAFNAEQAIAARSLLDASGRNVVRVARESEDNTDLADALAQHQAVLDAVRGVSAEAGRALGSFKAQTVETQVSNALRNLSGDALDEARTLLKKIDPNNQRQLNN